MHFGERLRQERHRQHLSQEALAEALGISPKSISRWERDQVLPQNHFRLQLAHFFGLPADELFVNLEEATSPAFLWSVPYPRNPFFTGREDLLNNLYEKLNQENTMTLTQSLAVSGLGGIGKTQTALEYTYRYRQNYRCIFWTSAASREVLIDNLVNIADHLQLPISKHYEQDQHKIVQAVSQWLATHQGWLWIIDNADDISIVQEFMPSEFPGHIILTSRAQALGQLAQRIEVETMGMIESILFLLRRAKILPPEGSLAHIAEEIVASAENIAIELDFLPLALDQAGAYIEEVGCSLSAYLTLYREHRKELLQRRGQMPSDHPEPVATTWSLSFEHIEQASATAADLLRIYAFLEADSIPENLLNARSTHIKATFTSSANNTLLLTEEIEELRKFSLIRRIPEMKTLRIHRLVQAVIKDALTKEDQRQWAEIAIQFINANFPEKVETSTWPDCKRYLPQVQACAQLARDYTITSKEAADLFSRAARYLVEYALYAQAEQLLQQALHILESNFGPDHPEIAQTLTSLANVYLEYSKIEQVEPLLLRALEIQKQRLGIEHPDTSDSLFSLARFLHRQGKYAQAEPLWLQLLHIREKTLGSEHLAVADVLLRLARVYNHQGKYEQAITLLLRVLSIREKNLGPDHLAIAEVLNNLATLHTEQMNYTEAEELYLRALHIREQTLGPEHPEVANILCNIGIFYQDKKQFDQALPFALRAVHIWEQIFEPNHADLSVGLYNLAEIYREQGQLEQAEQLYLRVVSIHAQNLNPEHPFTAHPFAGLANLYRQQKKNQQAELFYQRALHIRERYADPYHPDTAEVLHDFAVFLEEQDKRREAAALYQRELVIREHVMGFEHASVIVLRNRHTDLLKSIEQNEREHP